VKALIVTPYYPPHVGGIQMYSAGLAAELAARGWQVEVISASLPGESGESTIGEAGERLYAVRSRNLMRRLAVPIPDLATLRLLRGVMRSRYDLVVVQSHLFISNVLFALAARRSWRRTIWINHGSGHIPTGSPVTDRLISVYEHVLAAVLRRTVGAVVAVSNEAATWAVHMGVRPCGVVGNGIARSKISAARTSRPNDAPLRAVFAARLEESKGALDAIRIVGGLDRVELVICGDGTQAEAVRRCAAQFPGQVTLTGGVSPQRVHEELAKADLLLFPSRYPEGFPTVFLEAGSRGSAIVTYPVGGAEQICRTGGGWVVRSPDEARVLLAELAVEPARAHRAGETLRKLVMEEFTWPLVVNRVLAHVETR
jgi:glycosyltransferase involved in cell wall biosynthesis